MIIVDFMIVNTILFSTSSLHHIIVTMDAKKETVFTSQLPIEVIIPDYSE